MSTIEKIYKLYKTAYTVTTDSRTITQGCVFVALKGEHFDGNDFALNVAEEGIAACVIADRKDLPQHERLFVVEDSLKALQELANYHRKQLDTPIIGITGTNGKTTTKELVSAVLAKKYNILFTQGNFNNQLGVPLTLLRIKQDTELAVVEMGASHPGDINELTGIGEPNYGMITNIGRAHLRDFGGYEGVIKTKNEMYQYIAAHKGLLFVNKDNELLMDLSKSINKVTYGTSNDADIQGKLLSANPYLSVEWNGKKIDTQLVGDYNFENVMAAICIGTYFNVAANDIVETLSSYRPTNNRSQVIETARNRVVMDAYNANPTSMSHSIKNFRNICKSDNLLILGDMRELGNESEQEHKNILELLKELRFENVYLVGEEFQRVAKNSKFSTFINVEELAQYLQQHPVSGRDILVKGSNSIHLNKIIDSL
ncbi:MAG: UDP-N-acetylmuramoyl-tripeptide--D-alanyl-D-alanine ligase [Bacteroidales bacterium]|nr:UDP-N-acetylmuramoyl-tripeptide--D-alanyl-D-alanine ligase [Bacteroidales bacterium]MBO7528893.1 UDP-N-acetylmuramoyl-tripeptide--D-alanyl-D-alanine ligase [Bacteroidales bacterium]